MSLGKDASADEVVVVDDDCPIVMKGGFKYRTRRSESCVRVCHLSPERILSFPQVITQNAECLTCKPDIMLSLTCI